MDEDVASDIDPIKLAKLMGVDEGSIPEWGFAVVGVLDDTGQQRLETVTYGEPSVGTLVGVLEIIKQEIVMGVLLDDDEE